MLYVILTNILLGTVLISILSNTFAGIMENAHQEYLYVVRQPTVCDLSNFTN